MKSLILLALTFTLNAVAEESPIFNQAALFQVGFAAPKADLGKNLKTLGAALQGQSIYWFGYPWDSLDQIGAFCVGELCQVRVVFTASDFSKKTVVLSEIQKIKATITSFVTNEAGMFEGISGSVASTTGEISCDPKRWMSVPLWRNSIDELNKIGDMFRALDSADKLKWITDNLDCDPAAFQKLGNLTGVELQIDLTSSSSCPLTPNNLKTCFIGRGVYELTLQF